MNAFCTVRAVSFPACASRDELRGGKRVKELPMIEFNSSRTPEVHLGLINSSAVDLDHRMNRFGL